MRILQGCALLMMMGNLAYAGSLSSITTGIPGSDNIPQERASFGIQLENDVFAGDDDNYTNGIRFSFLSKSCGNEEAGASNSMARALGSLVGGTSASAGWSKFCGMDRTPALRQQWAVTLTQLMFTPQDMGARSPIIGQHPYAGYLALGIGTLVKNENRANSFELQLGTTGQASLAEKCQRIIHKMWGMPTWQGWDNQLPGEFTFCFFFKRYYRLEFLESRSNSGFETDGLAFWHADLGTVYVRAGAGMSFRYGYNLSDVSPDFTINGGTYISNPFVKKRDYSSNWSFYGFSGVGIRAVAHDIFLDGTVFHNSPHYVNKYPVVADVNTGAVVRYKNADLLFGFFFRSQEYHHQEALHVMGTIELKISF